MEKCTFCGKQFNNIKVEVNFNINSQRIRTDDTWEHIPNMDITTTEILCSECFDAFTEGLNAEMLKRKK